MINHKNALECAIHPVSDREINNLKSAYIELRRLFNFLVDSNTDKQRIQIETEIRRLIGHD